MWIQSNLSNCYTRHWAARDCGQPTANTIESAPEITPNVEKFPFCKESTCARAINGFHAQADLECGKPGLGGMGKRKIWLVCSSFLISTDFSEGHKTHSKTDCPVTTLCPKESRLWTAKSNGRKDVFLLLLSSSIQIPPLTLLLKLDKSLFNQEWL